MKLLLTAFVGIFCFASLLHPARADTPITKAQVLKAINTFQTDPVGKEGFAASAVIMTFARSSAAVHVSVTRDTTPWLTNKDASDADTRNILLTAYVAGNLAAQLKSGHASDDVYAGWEQLLNTYAQLLHINSAAKIEEVEELKKKEADGTLLNYATEVEGKR